MPTIHRAILSVTDKTGIVEFARKLAAWKIELISTGGTAKLLSNSGIPVKNISELTGFPEIMDGRVKALHPKVHGGILHIRNNPAHVAAAGEHGIQPIDMVVVNFYPFEETVSKSGVVFDELIDNIDIGGPAMVRSAAKNFRDVAIVISPKDYASIADEMANSSGELSLGTRWRLAQKAFATTAAYDSAISATLAKTSLEGEQFQLKPASSNGFPSQLRLSLNKVKELRYGENPHQRGALYSDGSSAGVANGRQLQGKELSYNNIVDLQAAWDLAQEFKDTVCVIVKHSNPCGTAIGQTLRQAYLRALEADPISAFGGVIGVNRVVDGETAEEIAKLFVEAIAAPGFDAAARQKLASKTNLRLVEISPFQEKFTLKHVSGGMLVQDTDMRSLTPSDLKIVTRRAPTAKEMEALLFAWKVCKHVKSNAVLFARDGQSVGVGAGQMSRVDSCKVGAMKAVLPLQGTVAASDAFFPFPDGIEEIARAGATAVIQQGGSVRDQEVIDAADRLGLAMVFTGIRAFHH
ncbi:MAG TPA: bifunctional phosphoribosylaminoimidazolecarboxamide formyltransferase/IMP cyclohydrolase [Candidatus Angelobacter sp.]|nr:bifunctional phosphoribosylaminoimidazolecarboxamide formyltransferase/IMP cyclohydrolase [Candidatus Angelobacter sp.]